MTGGAAGLLTRVLLGLVLAGAGALLFAWAMRRRAGPPPPDGVSRPSRCAGEGASPPAPGSRCQEILAYFGELRPGDVLARWTIAWIGGERDGAIGVGMRCQDGTPFELELRRKVPGGPAAPAEAGELAVFLVADRRGGATPEEFGLGAMTLASALEAQGTSPPAWLRAMDGRDAGLRRQG